MTTLAENIIQGRLDRQTQELEMNQSLSGQTFEALPLSLGDTTVEREVMADGTRGQVRISTQEVQGFLSGTVVYKRYILQDGEITTDPTCVDIPKPITGFRKFKLLAKVAFGKVDHWDKESDFFGNVEEEK
jgi:hypothetical protein